MRNVKKCKRMITVAVVAAMICGCTGCGSGSGVSTLKSDFSVSEDSTDSAYDASGFASSMESDASADVANYDQEEMQDDAIEMDSAAESTTGTTDSTETSRYAQSKKKIIKRYNYSYETEHFDDAYQFLKDAVNKYNGYVSNSEVNGRERRTLYLEARIPADVSDEFVSKLGGLGTVTGQSESAEDVTLQYADTEGRIASLKTEQERLLALLEKADKLENIITLEDRLTEVRYELESFESQKKVYDDLVSYSTITINLREVSYTVEVDETSILSRMETGLKKSIRDVGYDVVNGIVDFIIAIPYILLTLIKLLILFLIGRGVVRLVWEKIKNRKNKINQKKNEITKAESLKNTENTTVDSTSAKGNNIVSTDDAKDVKTSVEVVDAYVETVENKNNNNNKNDKRK